MDVIRIVSDLRLKSAPAALWPQLSNTNRMNRAVGLPENETSPVPGEGFMRRVVVRKFGLAVAWKEMPFEYVSGRYYSCVRNFENGPFTRFEGSTTLTPDGAGSRVVLDGKFTPRSALTRGVARVIASLASSDMAKMVLRVDESIAKVGDFPDLPRTATPVDESLLVARSAKLGVTGAEEVASARLIEHLRRAPDDEVVRFRPFELADRWGLPRLDVLGACLHAVKPGLLDMRWEILCPNCSTAPETHGTLAELKSSSNCPGCGIQYKVGFDDSVELRFSVHPSVREAKVALFCAGSPAHSPMAMAQVPLEADESRELDLSLEAKSYRVRALSGKRSALLRPRSDGAQSISIDLTAIGDDTEIFFKPGAVKLKLSTHAKDLARVEAETWRDAGATAALVTSLQEFRNLFSSEVLSPGLEISVKRLALLFTDLKSSTALYERVGDATAYGVVRDHFDFLTAIIAARRGAVVKTIGDAVMAVFASPADALEAALDMQERIGELDAKLAPREPVVLKIGVHEGAAIAINASGVIDYFGTTANVAARVQGESEGGDIVITDVLRDDPSAREVLVRRAPAEESFHSELKGLTGEHRLWRLRPRAKK
jgi:class 3 adenylate cyclase